MSNSRYVLVGVVTLLFLFLAAGSIDLDEDDFEVVLTDDDFAMPSDDGAAVDSDAEPASINEAVDMGDSVWTVLEAVDHGGELSSHNEYIDDLTSDGRLVMIRVKVENKSNEQQRLFETPPIQDSEGRKFSQVDTQTMYVPEDSNTMLVDALPAGMSREYHAIYEIAPGAEGLQFMAKDFAMFDASFHPIDLGL